MRNGWISLRLAPHMAGVVGDSHKGTGRRVMFWMRMQGQRGWHEFGRIYHRRGDAGGLLPVPEHSKGATVVAFKLLSGGP